MDQDYRRRREAPVEDTAPRTGLNTWRWESGERERASCNRRREWPDNLQERGRAQPWEGLPEALAHAAGEAPRCMDKNTLGRKANGPPEMEDGREGGDQERPGVPSWRAATGKPGG